MIREFKSSDTQFNTFIGIAIFAIIATVIAYMISNIIIIMLPIFAILWAVIAFWNKDRILITLHEDYLEAKEAIAAKKKLIRYSDISDAELHKSGRILTLYVRSNGVNKKTQIRLNSIEKNERKVLVNSIKSIAKLL